MHIHHMGIWANAGLQYDDRHLGLTVREVIWRNLLTRKRHATLYECICNYKQDEPCYWSGPIIRRLRAVSR